MTGAIAIQLKVYELIIMVFHHQELIPPPLSYMHHNRVGITEICDTRKICGLLGIYRSRISGSLRLHDYFLDVTTD